MAIDFESVNVRISAGYYKNNDPYPKRADFFTKVKEVEETFVGTKAQIAEAIKNAEDEASKLYVDAVQAHKEKTRQLEDQFKADLEAEFGVENNPKKDKLYEKAWDRGHAYGLGDVYIAYADLVELIEA